MASTISAGTTTTTALVYTADTSGVLQLQTNGTTTAVTIDTAQNVGVGVTPSAVTNTYQTLQIGNLGNALTGYKASPIVRLDNNCYISGGVSTYAVSGYKATSLQLYNGTAQFSVSSDATQTAGSPITFTQALTLNNAGSLNVTSSATNDTFNSYQKTTTTTDILANFLSDVTSVGTIKCRVLANGNLQNTNNSYGAISDIKLKENIVDATPKLADLMQVKVRNYNLKNDPTHKQLGVIAQELEQVFPMMIEESPDKDKDGNNLGTTTKSVKYSVFVPMLIKAIQELSAKVTALEAKVG